jgi:uncharacterized protein (DUF1697 family)
MVRRIALLRGINLGPRNRISMPELRELMSSAGCEDAQTYLQSGNLVFSGDATADEIEQLIAERFGFQIDVLDRTADELAEVVARNPLKEVAVDPKRYQVSFLAAELDDERLGKLSAAAAEPERLVAIGRELYAWHPAGIARSKLWARLAGPGLGVKTTARNWTTVTKLLEVARG